MLDALGIQLRIAWLNIQPKTDEERREQFKAQRRIVKMPVEKVKIQKGNDGEKDP